MQGIGISPDCNPENRASPRQVTNFFPSMYLLPLNTSFALIISNQLQLFNWALEPAEDEILDKFYELGYRDAAVWAEQNSTESTSKNDKPLAVD